MHYEDGQDHEGEEAEAPGHEVHHEEGYYVECDIQDDGGNVVHEAVPGQAEDSDPTEHADAPPPSV